MITENGWLPRNTVITVPLTDRGQRRKDGKRYWEVLDWTSGLPVKIGGWGCAVIDSVRVRPYYGGPWCYETVREIHRAAAARSRS